MFVFFDEAKVQLGCAPVLSLLGFLGEKQLKTPQRTLTDLNYTLTEIMES